MTDRQKYSAVYYQKHRDRILKRSRDWTAANREHKNAVGRDYYRANAARIIARTSQDRKVRRRVIVAAKARPCKDCRRRYPSYVMDFDHVRGIKLATISQMKSSLADLRAEIAKCDVVCANCHRKRTHKRGKRGFRYRK